MTSKRVDLREQADFDIDEALRFYLDEGAEDAAGEFIASVEQALGHIGRHPATGSLKYAHELGLPDLRFWPIKVFPCLDLLRRSTGSDRRLARAPRATRDSRVDGQSLRGMT